MVTSKQSAIKKYLIVGTASILALLTIWFFSEIFILLFLSLLIALILDPVVSFFENIFWKRSLSTGITFAVVFLVLSIAFSKFVPSLVSQIGELSKNLRPEVFKQEIKAIENIARTYFPLLQENILSSKFETFIADSIEGIINQFSKVLSGFFSVAAFVVIVPFITFFIVKDRQSILKGMLNLLPNKYFEMSYWVLKKVSEQMGKYVRGWLLDAAFVGISCGVAFNLLGIPNSFALGIIAGLGHLIPYFGPIIGGVPAMLILVVQHPNDLSLLPILLLLLLLIYIVDNGFVQPYVFSKSTGLHPLAIILLIIAGSKIMGIMGMLFAVPIATIIKTLLFEAYYAYKNYRIVRI